MSTTTTPELCRVTVVTPTKFADLAIPAHVSVAELTGAMLHACGDDDLHDVPVVVQRLSGATLPPDTTLAHAAVLDGETLYLRPSESAAPPMVFDDLIDGVGSVVAERADNWSPSATQWLFTTVAAAVLTFGLFAMVWPGPTTTTVSQAGFTALALVIVAAINAQVYERLVAARLCGVFAVLYAGVAGVAAPGLFAEEFPVGREIVRGWMLSVDALIIGSAAIAVTASLLLFVTGSDLDLFVGVIVTGVSGAATGAIVASGQPGDRAAAIVVASLVLVAPAFTSVAYRCAGLAPPELPREIEDLRGELVETPPPDVVERRGRRADQTLTGLHAGSSLTIALWLPIVGLMSGTAPVLLTVLVVMALFLRARLLTGGRQRSAVVAAGLVGVLTLVWRTWWSGRIDGGALDVPVILLVAGAVCCLLAAANLPNVRLTPYWGRAADLAESFVAVATLPVLFGVLDVYDAARAVGG